jgi:RHS repeat-associated protein
VHGPGVDVPLARGTTTGSLSSFYHADGLGSIVKRTDVTGNVESSRVYDSFGQAASLPSGYSFTGREWDSEDALYYYRARYYDPRLGRFLSEDPIALSGGDINYHAYVSNNPVNVIDPTGLTGVDAVPIDLPFPWVRPKPICVPIPTVPGWLVGVGAFVGALGTGSSSLPTSDLDELYNPEVCGARNEKGCGLTMAREESRGGARTCVCYKQGSGPNAIGQQPSAGDCKKACNDQGYPGSKFGKGPVEW